jgi:hypothetical protein
MKISSCKQRTTSIGLCAKWKLTPSIIPLDWKGGGVVEKAVATFLIPHVSLIRDLKALSATEILLQFYFTLWGIVL